MFEAINRLSGIWQGIEPFQLLQRLEVRVQVTWPVPERSQQPARYIPTQNRRALEEPFGGLGEAIHTGHEHPLDGLGYSPCGLMGRIESGLCELFEEERIPFRFGQETIYGGQRDLEALAH